MPHILNNVIPTTLTDEEIIANIKEGAINDFRILMKKYNQRLYRIALSFGINDFDVDDILQQTYISAFKKLDQFKGESKFYTWLTKILINQCLMYKRNRKTLKQKSEETFSDFSERKNIQSEYNPEELYMKSELKDILENAINMLPEKYRVVYVVREIEGLNVKETAELLDISEENVKVRLFRSKDLIKDYLLANFDKKELFSFGNDRCDRVADNVMSYIVSNLL